MLVPLAVPVMVFGFVVVLRRAMRELRECGEYGPRPHQVPAE
jgi:hypothetical protein